MKIVKLVELQDGRIDIVFSDKDCYGFNSMEDFLSHSPLSPHWMKELLIAWAIEQIEVGAELETLTDRALTCDYTSENLVKVEKEKLNLVARAVKWWRSPIGGTQ